MSDLNDSQKDRARRILNSLRPIREDKEMLPLYLGIKDEVDALHTRLEHMLSKVHVLEIQRAG